jgi:hypothetical protein
MHMRGLFMKRISGGWVAEERLWLRHVRDDVSLGWGGVLEMLSLVTLVATSAIGWIAVIVLLLRSV